MVNLGGAAAGAALVAIGNTQRDPKLRTAFSLGGAALVLLSARDVLGFAREGIEGLGEIGSGIRERLSAEPEVAEVPDRPAEEGGFHLGQPRNLARIAGAIRDPQEGEEVRRGILERRFTVDTAIENQSGTPQLGAPVLWIETGGERTVVEGPEVTLAPGSFRTFTFEVPPGSVSILNPFAVGVTARLRWNGHGLDQVAFLVD